VGGHFAVQLIDVYVIDHHSEGDVCGRSLELGLHIAVVVQEQSCVEAIQGLDIALLWLRVSWGRFGFINQWLMQLRGRKHLQVAPGTEAETMNSIPISICSSPGPEISGFILGVVVIVKTGRDFRAVSNIQCLPLGI